MRKVIVLTVIALMTAGSSLAWTPDQMGIYFDTDATVYDDPGVAAGDQISIYIMLTHPSHPEVAAWECQVVWDQMGGLFFGSWALTNNGVNVGDISDPMAMNFAVGTGAQPIQTSDATILATWSGIFASGTGSCFYVKEYPGGSFPDEHLPGYAADETTLVPCGISSGSPDQPVASFGNGCPGIVGNNETAWSTVKTLYR